MKITHLITYRLPPRWVFLKIETDEGVTGWDEPAVEGHTRTVEATVHELSYYLIDQSPNRINSLQRTMYRVGSYRGGPILMSAVAGIDRALWGIKSKALGVPVYELFGGLMRDEMRTCSWVGGDYPADMITGMKTLWAVGFDHFKFNGCEEMDIVDTFRAVDTAVTRATEIRSAFGNTVESGFDLHGHVSAPMTGILIKELEPYRPLFIEKPAFAEQTKTYAYPTTHTRLPIAAGERMFSYLDFRCVLEANGMSILQPDLSHAGSITECVKIVAVVEIYGVMPTPHCSLDPTILVACLHVNFVNWNATLQEQSMDIRYNKGVELLDYMQSRADFALEDGYIRPPRLPGLSMDIGEALVIECSKETLDWHDLV